MIARVDHRFSNSNQFYVRYADAGRKRIEPQTLQTITREMTNDFHNLAVSDTHIISSATLLDLRSGYIRDNIVHYTPPPAPGTEAIFAAGLQTALRVAHNLGNSS